MEITTKVRSPMMMMAQYSMPKYTSIPRHSSWRNVKSGWPFTPAFTQVYVTDVDAALNRAKNLGAKVITKPTDYVGVTFSRVQDPQGNIWWIWAMLENYDWEAAFDSDNGNEDWKPTREAVYVHDSLVEAMEKLSKEKE